MTDAKPLEVTIRESGNGPYGQIVTAGRHIVGADEPEALGGRDTGPSPYEFLMAGLGACTAMTMRIYADRHTWPLQHITVIVSHEKLTLPGGTGKADLFKRTITLDGTLSDEQKNRLLQIAERCPVSETLRRSSEVATSLVEAGATAT